MERKKELKEAYRQMQIPMGVYMIRNRQNGRMFLDCTPNLPGKMNSSRFQLQGGIFRNAALQKDWQNLGEEAFEIAVLDALPYDQTGLQTDYREDLQALLGIWQEKLSAERGADCFYNA